MMRTLKTLNHQRGLALVETAITLPFLLFVMLAASDFTNAFVQHTTLTKAVRDGARYAADNAINKATTVFDLTTAIQDDAKRLIVYGNKAGTGAPAVSGLSVTDVTVTAVGANNIEVSLSYPYTGILGSVLPGFGYGSDMSLLLNMSATVTMRAL